jgi:hypothetical protein
VNGFHLSASYLDCVLFRHKGAFKPSDELDRGCQKTVSVLFSLNRRLLSTLTYDQSHSSRSTAHTLTSYSLY